MPSFVDPIIYGKREINEIKYDSNSCFRRNATNVGNKTVGCDLKQGLRDFIDN